MTEPHHIPDFFHQFSIFFLDIARFFLYVIK